MLENGDGIEVSNRCIRGTDYAFRISTHEVAGEGCTSLYCETRGAFVDISGSNKLYAINLNHVECIVGEWNKDKTEYGVRIFYTSGNSVWIGNAAAKKLIFEMDNGVENSIDWHLLDK